MNIWNPEPNRYVVITPDGGLYDLHVTHKNTYTVTSFSGIDKETYKEVTEAVDHFRRNYDGTKADRGRDSGAEEERGVLNE